MLSSLQPSSSEPYLTYKIILHQTSVANQVSQQQRDATLQQRSGDVDGGRAQLRAPDHNHPTLSNPPPCHGLGWCVPARAMHHST